MVVSRRTAACIILRQRQESPMCQHVQNREEGSTRTKNGRVRYLPDMLLLGRQNTAGARQQGSRCRGRRGHQAGHLLRTGGHGNKDGNYDRDLQPALRQTRLPPLPRIRHFLCGPRLIRTTPTLLVTMGYGLLTYQVQGLDAEPSIIIIPN